MIFVPVSVIRLVLVSVLVSVFSWATAQVSCRIVLSNPADSTQKVAILHKRNFIETFHRPFKTFSMVVDAKDTLYVMSKGYKSQIIAGSAISGQTGVVEIRLLPLSIQLHTIRIKPMIALDTLTLRAHHIGDVPNEFKPTYSNIDVINSPLTALWAQFNSLERQKRKIAALIEEKDIHDIMVAYLDICNKESIIDLPTADYDSFIHYARFTPETLKYNTQYDILNTIRYLYIQYMAINQVR